MNAQYDKQKARYNKNREASHNNVAMNDIKEVCHSKYSLLGEESQNKESICNTLALDDESQKDNKKYISHFTNVKHNKNKESIYDDSGFVKMVSLGEIGTFYNG
ncbi:hypothetical protein LS73_009795 [Helicobacter muridarum]|uniref:Uncharacterized protein n=1 Tax=Helicobacter muridarum TaxID=216 RepID=A0A099TTZ8_9HELI|nr:hypothetical protein [Helicobacter muridarum]TLD97007.1 hypothetical protein LS73_009795 [Helicobacter muridarum]STQ85431.1 Uncharacterised protein [Helicobacter muridarum]